MEQIAILQPIGGKEEKLKGQWAPSRYGQELFWSGIFGLFAASNLK